MSLPVSWGRSGVSHLLRGWDRRPAITNTRLRLKMSSSMRWVFPLLVSTFSSQGFAASSVDEKYIFVSQDAINIREDAIPNGKQVSFDVKRKYPLLGWDSASVKKAEAAGWKGCSGPDFGTWRVYGDKTASQPRLVHQHSLMLVKVDRALMVVGHYHSHLPGGPFPKSIRPDNEEQHVTVIEIFGTKGDIERTRLMFSATCSK
jgi:hypothetical protein